MQVQTVNNHARKRYSEFESALETVRIAVDELQKTARGFPDGKSRQFSGWQVPTKGEVVGAIRRAGDDMETLRANARKYKSELISRGWRV